MKRRTWRILMDAGLVIIILMGLALMGLAIGFALGTGLVKL